MKTLPRVSMLEEVEVSPERPGSEEAGLGALRTARGLLPLESVDLRATIDGLTASLRLTQTFVNVHDETLEATYIFPLPERAAVQRFRLQVGERVIEGELKERGQARREYREAITKGHQAAIAEEERSGVFTLRVGNIPPGERATVHLDLAQPLPSVEGEGMFRFPLVVAPRYIPGTPLNRPASGAGSVGDTDAVPDASRIRPPVLLPGFPNPVDLSIEVYFPPTALLPDAVRSSLHTVVAEEAGEGLRLRVLAGERLNRDFILRFRLADRVVKTGLTLHPDADGQGGTFALTVLPPGLEAQTTRPRDLVFVLDRSGSMGGWKMVTARRAGVRLIEDLTEADRFAVYAFDDRIDTVAEFKGDGLVPATFRNRTRALEFLQGVDSRGGTEMAQPLDLALSRLLESGSDSGRDKVLIFITDGQVGNENQLLKQLGSRLKHVRVHALGIDQAVNAGFLQKLADLGGGSSTLVESEDRLEVAIDGVQRLIGTPVLTGLSLAARGFEIQADSVVPARLPDLFVGNPLVILGRYAGASEGTLTLGGRAADGVTWTVDVPARVQSHAALPALWARQKLRDLEDRYAIAASNELERLIVEISLRHSVLCRFTSFVAVDRSRVVNASGKQHQVTQAVETPVGWGEQTEKQSLRRLSTTAMPAPAACAAPMAPPPINARQEAPADLADLAFDETDLDDDLADGDCEEEECCELGLGTLDDSVTTKDSDSLMREAPRPAKSTRSRSAPKRDEAKKKESKPAEKSPQTFDRRTAPGTPAINFIQQLGNLAGSIVRGVQVLFGMARKAGANPLDRSRFRTEVAGLLAILRGESSHTGRLALLPTVLPRLYLCLQQIVAAGDLGDEVRRLGAAVQMLGQSVETGTPDEATLSPLWLEVLSALEAYQTLIEPEGFWK